MSDSAADISSLGYEDAIRELETIIEGLESSQPSLEEALSLYERGQALALHCAALLDRAELRVHQLGEREPEQGDQAG